MSDRLKRFRKKVRMYRLRVEITWLKLGKWRLEKEIELIEWLEHNEDYKESRRFQEGDTDE